MKIPSEGGESNYNAEGDFLPGNPITSTEDGDDSQSCFKSVRPQLNDRVSWTAKIKSDGVYVTYSGLVESEYVHSGRNVTRVMILNRNDGNNVYCNETRDAEVFIAGEKIGTFPY